MYKKSNVTRNPLVKGCAFKTMEEGPPLGMTDIASKPLTGAVFRKDMVLNE